MPHNSKIRAQNDLPLKNACISHISKMAEAGDFKFGALLERQRKLQKWVKGP